jgi:murein DD-endopeptidase MepM/ murein hydrolase activator NlpD
MRRANALAYLIDIVAYLSAEFGGAPEIIQMERLAKLRQSLERLFPERHLYVRSGAQIRGFVLTTSNQAACAVAICLAALWLGLGSAAMLWNTLSVGSGDQKVLKVKAYYERALADRQARLTSAVAELDETSGSMDQLAHSVEERHRALAMLIAPMKGQPVAATAAAASPVDRIRAVQLDQDRLLADAETSAKDRADRLRLALKLAGLDPSHVARPQGELGGPLIEGKDPKALAAVLDVDEAFAGRIQHVAGELGEERGLEGEIKQAPFGEPALHITRSSGFGARYDPITGRPAFHPGLDLAGSLRTPIYATGPGVVSFAGVRSGYGNTIEIDHGQGLKTRYGHLAAIAVNVGQNVAVGQRIGAMGSTGRSTGPHLHYEVWVDGKQRDPDRFLKAGEYVQQQAQ